MTKMRYRSIDDDIFEYLSTHPEQQVPYVADALHDDDVPILSFLLALRQVARVRGKGIAELSSETSLNRENLYRMLSRKGNPTFSNVVAIMDSIGLEFTVREKKKSKPVRRV